MIELTEWTCICGRSILGDICGACGRRRRSTNDGGSNPKQYALPKDAKELQDLIEHRNMNFAIGNIFKACYRYGNCDHSSKKRDLEKVIWFANRELDRINK